MDMKKPIKAPGGYHWEIAESADEVHSILSLVKNINKAGVRLPASYTRAFRFGPRMASRKIVRAFRKDKAAKKKVAK